MNAGMKAFCILICALLLLAGCKNKEKSSSDSSFASTESGGSYASESSSVYNSIPEQATEAIEKAAQAITPSEEAVEMINERRQIETDATLRDCVATVNDCPIYEWELELAMHSNRVTVENGRKQIEQAQMPEEDKQRVLQDYQLMDEDEILNQLIRSEVIKQMAEKEGITVTDEEALQAAKDAIDQVKQMLISENVSEREQAEQIYGEMKAAYTSYGITEEAYLQDYAGPSYKTMMISQRLHDAFVSGLSESEKPNAESLYQAYIDESVEAAKVVIH